MPLEVHRDAKHDRRGILSMARWEDPNSGGASFSITLGGNFSIDINIFGLCGTVVDKVQRCVA